MKKILLSSLACATLVLAANSDYKYEITPLIGGGLGEGNHSIDRNYANAGLALGFNQSEGSLIDQFELGFLRTIQDVDGKNSVRNQDTSITRVFGNFVKDYGLTNDLSLYALAGLGVEFFDNELTKHQKDGIFGNYGVGLKYQLTDALALKFDLRHLISAQNGDNTLLYNFGLAIPFGEKAAKVAPVAVAPVAPVIAPIDSDGDGVIDELDQCPDTMKGAKVDSVGCMTLVNLNVNFDTAKSDIKDIYGTRIHEFAKVMNADKKLKASIEGHTDSVGSVPYNQKLSERRAASVVKALENLGVEKGRLNSVGYGKSRPIASNDTAEGKAENRRVHAVMSK
ncbi:flagellar motor protein MotB [Aliarcobacter trophiarum LMG 25534]|uniref:Flagellar motor protein MotB n=1 Tax=Aliarcobacter trophiarum LMG 25534 TaxID=1032241 RepID=A0AAD0VMI2_9BACT|nr:OmpA family protein [Aliarcobacter trophiarum]AXK49352.1 outer membrane fibronectin-binding protein [Aliarcobacter trophiarum LMG 25534]RXI27700.1 flagellar motor protein MotB [Aliarcobacter trophiarum]RXJ90082.1 flagellar motor protein MotB [Aliarcobacter trophiarum LMG 25534]